MNAEGIGGRRARATPRVPVREIGALAVLGMETAVLVPWFRSLTAPTQALGTYGALLLMMAVAALAMALARAAAVFGLGAGARRAMLLTALAAVLLAAIRIVVYRDSSVGIVGLVLGSFSSFESVITVVPVELVVVLGGLYCWRRGIVASAPDALDPGWIAYKMRLGILAHVAFALIYGLSGAGRLLEILPFYFGAGLTGIAMSRADALMRLRGAGRSPFAWQWVGGILALTGGTVALGIGVANALVSPPAFQLAERAGETALRGVEFLLRLASPLILGIVTLLDRFMRWVLEVTRFDPTLLRLRELIPLVSAPTTEASPPPGLLEPYRAPLQVIGTTLLIVLLAVLAVRASRRSTRKGCPPWEDQADALAPRALRPLSLRGILARAQARVDGARRFGGRFLAAAAVRRIYARLLALAEARGRTRAPAETPREFMPQLWALFPSHRAEVEVITEEYLRVRYGEYPEAAEAVARVRAAWSVLLEEARLGSGG